MPAITAAMIRAASDELDPLKPGPYMMQIKRAIQAALDAQPDAAPREYEYREAGAINGHILYMRCPK